MIESLQNFFESSSMTMRFVLIFSLILLTPRLFQKLKLPAVLALIFIGVLFGPKGMHLFKENGQVLLIFAMLGKLLLLFFSGLDIEIDVLKKNLGKSLQLAALSFTIPALGGIVLGLLCDYSFMTSLMIAVLFSSHSIIAYPILARLGLTKHEPVSVTVGATAITDITSLVLFAICLPIHTTGFEVGPFLLQIIYIVGFIPIIIFGFQWLSKTVFKRLGEDAAQQMIFLLLVVGMSAQVAEMVNVEPIVGAFLAGLAVSTTLPNIGVRTQLDTLGNTLFIPSFFISLGILIDPVMVIQTVREHFALVVSVILVVMSSKVLAAWIAGKKIGYNVNDRVLIGSLTLPQVSSTLAVALIAYESMNTHGERLIDEPLLNSILVLMVVSAVIGTILTEWTAKRIVLSGISDAVKE
jgi:Kef-type K+ transport system membrane component KefB